MNNFNFHLQETGPSLRSVATSGLAVRVMAELTAALPKNNDGTSASAQIYAKSGVEQNREGQYQSETSISVPIVDMEQHVETFKAATRALERNGFKVFYDNRDKIKFPGGLPKSYIVFKR